MKGTCAILDGEIITSPRSPPDSTVVYQLGLPKIREIKYDVLFDDCCFFYDILQPFKAMMYFNFYIFYCLICRCETAAKRSPPYFPLQLGAFLQNAPTHTFLCNCAPSPCPSHGQHRILVGCCVHRFYCGHLWSWPHPSLYMNFFLI